MKKHGFLHRFFIDFSCFFQTTFQMAFLEGPRADLGTKVRFWSHFRFSRVPKIDLWNPIFDQKGSKSRVPRIAVSVLEPTWAQPAAQNAARTHFHWFWTDLWPIWGRFWWIWHDFPMFFIWFIQKLVMTFYKFWKVFVIIFGCCLHDCLRFFKHFYVTFCVLFSFQTNVQSFEKTKIESSNHRQTSQSDYIQSFGKFIICKGRIFQQCNKAKSSNSRIPTFLV